MASNARHLVVVHGPGIHGEMTVVSHGTGVVVKLILVHASPSLFTLILLNRFIVCKIYIAVSAYQCRLLLLLLLLDLMEIIINIYIVQALFLIA